MQDHVQKDFIKVNIFFESKTIQLINENPLMGTQALLSSLGGAFSLYLGISIIALFEIIELLAGFIRGMVSSS